MLERWRGSRHALRPVVPAASSLPLTGRFCGISCRVPGKSPGSWDRQVAPAPAVHPMPSLLRDEDASAAPHAPTRLPLHSVAARGKRSHSKRAST